MDFADATKDGNRIVRVWKHLLPLFRATGRINYSVEAFTFFSQYYFLLSPKQAAQLALSRMVNTHGHCEENTSCDLHPKYINRKVKNALGELSSNTTEQSVKTIGKSIQVKSPWMPQSPFR